MILQYGTERTRRTVGNDIGVGIDLTPIIDMVFMLLIFFLTATTFLRLERETKIALPETRMNGPISSALKEIVINVDAQGRSIVSGRTLDDDALLALVQGAVGANPAQKVNVRGDRTTAYANVARVLDICKRGGISEPFLETMPTRQ